MKSFTKTLVLYQPNNGYCYNSDTHFLYNFIVKNFEKYKNIHGDFLDIGSGSGVLGLLIARDYQKLDLHQCEIQKTFQFLSEKNSQINNISSTLYKNDFLEQHFNKTFDYIVSNPPFYHGNVIKSENENIKTARYNDSMPLDKFISKISSIIKPKGHLFFCYDVKQLSTIIILLEKHKLNLESLQFLHPNKNKEATLVMIAARKNSKSLLKILPPIIMFNEDGSFTLNTNKVYERCATHSIKCDIL
jgi:tRNA1Val (adenine37-N6)-methyltransferase